MKNKLLSVQQAAHALGVSTRTLKRYEESGILTPERTPGDHRRYSPEAIEAFKKAPRPAKISETDKPIPLIFDTANPPTFPSNFRKAQDLSSQKEKPPAYYESHSLDEHPKLGFFTVSSSVKAAALLMLGLFLLAGLTVAGAQNSEEFDTFARNALAPILGQEKTPAPGPGIASGSLQNHEALYNKKGEMLGEISINIPALFTRKVTINADALVTGNATISGALNVEGDFTAIGNLTAPNILYSIIPGQNISISGNPQNPIISALSSGVTSFQGQTGAVTLTAGPGITINANQISNADPGSSQSIFKTFSVAGQPDIKAGSNSDIFTFVQGAGISLLTDADNKKLTITNTSDATLATGWTDSGTSVILTTATDNVGIGTPTPSSKLHVLGTSTLDGAAIISGGLNNSGSGIINAGSITGGTGFTSSGTITFGSFGAGIVHANASGVLSSSAVNLASADVTGILPATSGGTGLSSYVQGDMIYASGVNTLAKLGIGATDQVLTVAGGVPTWAAITGSGGICSSCLVNNPGSTQTISPTGSTTTGLSIRQTSTASPTVDIFNIADSTGATKYFRVDSTGNVILGTGSSTGVFTVSPTGTYPIAISPAALSGSTFTGTLTSDALTQARTWTFPDASGSICLTTGNCSGTGSNLGGSGTTNYLSKWSGTYALGNSLMYDDGTNIGIGTTTPGYKLEVAGTFNSTGAGTFASTLGVTGATTLSSTLGVTGATTLSSTLNVTGATTLSSTLGVTGGTTIGGNLSVDGTGNSYFMGNVGIGVTNPGARLQINTGAAGTIGQIIQGAASQTADLLQIQNSTGTVLSRFTASGALNLTGLPNNSIALLLPGGSVSFAGGATISNPNADNSLRFTAGTNGFIFTTTTSMAVNTGQAGINLTNSGINGLAPTGYVVNFTGGDITHASSTALRVQNNNGTTTFNVNPHGSTTITNYAATDISLTLKGAASQTADLQQWQNSAGTVLTSVNSSGSIKLTQAANRYLIINHNWQGTGYPSIQVKSDSGAPFMIESQNGINFTVGVGGAIGRTTIGGEGAASVALKVLGVSGQTADLLQLQDSTGAVKTKFTANGAIDLSGVGQNVAQITLNNGWNISYGAAQGTGANTIIGNTSFNGDVYFRVGQAILPQDTSGPGIGLTIRGRASQTGNLLQLQDNNNLINGAFNGPGNQLTLGRVAASGTVTQGKLLFSDGTTDNFSGTLQTTTLTGNQTYTLPDSTGTFCLSSQNCSGAGTGYILNGTSIQSNANFAIQSAAAASVGGVIRGAASQTADLLQLQNSSGTVLGKFSTGSSNNFVVYPGASLAAVFMGVDPSHPGIYALNTSGSTTHVVLGVNGSGARTRGQFLVDSIKEASASTVKLIVTGTASQTADLTQWQDSTGAVLANIKSDGAFLGSNLQNKAGGTAPYLSMTTTGFNFITQAATGNFVLIDNASNAGGIALRVKGAASQTADLLQLQNSSGAVLSGFTANGYLGLGTTAPTGLLQVSQATTGPGTVATNGTTTLTGTNTQFLNTFKVGDTITVSGETVRTISTIASNTSLTVSAAFSTTASSLSYTLTGGDRLTVLGNGNVGIGTTAPSENLDVNGNAKITSLGVGANPPGSGALIRGVYIGYNTATSIGGAANGRAIEFSGTNTLLNSTAGNVGIGTTAPGYRLDVLNSGTAQTASNRLANFSNAGATFDTTAGALNSYGGYFSSTSTRSAGANALTNIGLYATASGAQNNYAAIFESGNVGIGTTAPTRTFDVVGDHGGNLVTDSRATETAAATYTVSTKALAYYLSSNSTTTDTSFTTTFNITGLLSTEGSYAFIYSKAEKDITTGSQTHTTEVQINGTQVSTIATTTGTAADTKLENYIIMYVNGAWRISGYGPTAATNTTVDAADLAEWIAYTGDKPQPGEVLTTGDAPVSVKKSQTAYDKKLIGIVTTNPYTVMSAETPNSIKLALSGRVPVKVSSEGGAIEAGDYVTSSSTPGVAMKAVKAGFVIGKALEPWTPESGKATVMVLVNVSYIEPTEEQNTFAGLSFDEQGNLILASTTTPEEEVTALGGELNPNPYPLTPKKDLGWNLADIVRRLTELEEKVSTGLADSGVNNQLSVFRKQTDDLQSRTASLEAEIKQMSLNPIPHTLNSEASSSAQLGLNEDMSINNATASGTLSVLGRTLLTDVGITGKFTAGLLAINGLTEQGTATINTVSGPLMLQSDGFNGVDILDGKVVIDTKGNMKVAGSVTVKKLNVDVSEVASASLGSGVIPTSDTQVIINTQSVTKNSKIFTSPTVELTTPITLSIIDKVPGKSFTVKLSSPAPQNIAFDWWIVN